MKVLLVRLSSMGDLIHTLYAVEDLMVNNPSIELHWICEGAFKDIPHLHPFVKKVHIFSWRSYRKRLWSPQVWHTIKTQLDSLKQEKFDLVIDSQGLIKSAVIAKWAGKPVHGFSKYNAREKWASHWYDKTYFIKETDNVIWKNRQLFARIFGYSEQIERKNYNTHLEIPSTISLDFIVPDQFHLAVLGASKDYKLWKEKNWQFLFKQRYDIDHLPILLTWGNEKEKNIVERVASGLSFVNVCPKMSLMQVAQLISKSNSIISVDTGLLHLANALNKPTLGIYPSTSMKNTQVEYRPWAQVVEKKETNNLDWVARQWQSVIEASRCSILSN